MGNLITVKIRFNVTDDKVKSMKISEPGLTIAANKI